MPSWRWSRELDQFKKWCKKNFWQSPTRSGRKQHLIAGLRFPDSLSQAKEIGCLPKESSKKKIMSQKMAYLKSANANRNFKIAISLLNNMANLPEVEVLADIKLEFMECCKYELPDPRLKIPYLFMKPIFSSGGGNTRTTIQRLAVLSCSSETGSKLYSKVWKWIHKVSWGSRDPTEARTRHPDGRPSKQFAKQLHFTIFLPPKGQT